MTHRIYKVVSRNNGYLWSLSTRDPDLIVCYPIMEWITMPVGLSFVFIEEKVAKDFLSIIWTRFNRPELWQAESQDAPQQLPGMARRWGWIRLFWEAHAEKNIALLATLCQPCPETYYGVRTIRLLDRLR